MFAESERLFREVGDRVELGKLLCARGELEAKTGDLVLARAILTEAEALAAAVTAGPNSDLVGKLARLAEVLGSSRKSA